mgnify:CR=1 FL=1
MRRVSRRLRLAVFIAYAATLAVATHWPGVVIDGPVPRSDLWVHLGAFGLWAMLLAITGVGGKIGGPKNLLGTLVIGVMYAAVDEFTQQFFGRISAFDDFLADAIGVVLGTASVGFAAAIVHRRDHPNGGVERDPDQGISSGHLRETGSAKAGH